MKFNEHLRLVGEHSFLSASKYHWINYDQEKLDEAYMKYQASMKGTKLHEIASELIDNGIKLPKTGKTLNMYVNDAIGYRMHTEQVLYYSENAFATTDAISFRRNMLRIHDLKTGVIPAHIEQLYVYAAYFCLEYDVKPNDINMELRIYQNDDVVIDSPDPADIIFIMDKIVMFDKRINMLKLEGNSNE